MNGTVTYYAERLMTSIMNRLVESEAMTLSEQYTVCKKEIELLDESLHVREHYLNNLEKAYDHIQLYMNGTEQISFLN